MSWETDLDRWLTTPPEPEEIAVGNCEKCDDTLFAYDEGYRDSRNGFIFCGRDCFKAWLLENINDDIDEFIDLLEKNRDTGEVDFEID